MHQTQNYGGKNQDIIFTKNLPEQLIWIYDSKSVKWNHEWKQIMNENIRPRQPKDKKKFEQEAGGYSKGLRNQNCENLVNLYELNKPETQAISLKRITQTAITSSVNFLLKVQVTKTKITCQRVIGDGCILDGISLMNNYWVSLSVSFTSSFKCSHWCSWCVSEIV